MSMQLATLLKSSSGFTKFVNSIVGGAEKVYKSVGGMSTAIMNSGMASADNFTTGMSIVDQYMDVYNKIALMNGGLENAKELQDKIFAAANRSRTSYDNMASSMIKMNAATGGVFDNNDELIAFTELSQKAIKLGGGDENEQNVGMDRLIQAMSTGSVGENQLVGIMNTAPKIAEAISTYTGKSKEELRRMAAQGDLTAGVIKNSMLSMSADINSDFKKMKIGFKEMWEKVRNYALEAFGPVIIKINELANSELFQGFINVLIGGIKLVADIALWAVEVIGWIGEKMIENWSIIQPILMAVGIILLTLFVMILVNLASIAVAWIASFWPVFLIIGIIGLLIYCIIEFGETFMQVAGWIYGAINVIWYAFDNVIVFIFNAFIWLANGIDNIVTGIINGILALINTVIEAVNRLRGTEFKTILYFEGLMDDEYFEYTDLGSAWKDGNARGQGDTATAVDSFKGMSDKLAGLFSTDLDLDVESDWKVPAFNESSPTLPKEMGITNVGGQPLDVAIDQDDIKYIQDLAERDYVAKFGTATLAPNISVSFGDVHESMDINQVQGHVARILREEIAMVGEG